MLLFKYCIICGTTAVTSVSIFDDFGDVSGLPQALTSLAEM